MISEGIIVPSEVTIKLLEKAIMENENDKFLIDGFPRNEENRAAFELVTGIVPEFVLFFDCSEEEMEKRLLGRNQNAILDLALQFKNSCNAKEDLRKAYGKCNDISQESRALIDTFLKEGSDKYYELNLSMYGKAAKLEKQIDAKLAWLLEKYYYRSQESVSGSSSHADLYLTEKELHQLHLDEEALRETLEEKALDEKAREEKISLDIDDSDLHLTLVLRSPSSARVEPSSYTPNPVHNTRSCGEYAEEEAKAEKERARAEKEWTEEIKKEEAHNELFRLEFGVISDSEYETD
nr:UMP-CMP kinase 3-like isoform X1 [Tanacetum cinerariifolium]